MAQQHKLKVEGENFTTKLIIQQQHGPELEVHLEGFFFFLIQGPSVIMGPLVSFSNN